VSWGTTEAPKGRNIRKLSRPQRAALSNQTSTSLATRHVNLKYHRLRCEICRHDLCQQIEEAILQWRSPKVIMHCFGIKTETTIYHHAHALGLFDLCNRSLSHALANIIEEVDTVRPTARDVLRAVYTLAHINDHGQWIHPTSKSEVLVSNNRTLAASPLRQPDPAPAPLSTLATHHLSPPESIASEAKSKANANR
jgi:hypothetical protein